MQNTKIIQFLKCLSESELTEFKKFVRSPFHNNRKDVIRLYDVLKKYYPDFNIDEAVKESIFNMLYPGKKYDSNVLILLSSYLFNLGKEFLAIKDLKEDRFLYMCHFLKGLHKHFADGLFEKEFRYAEDFLKNEKLNQESFLQQSQLEEIRINFNLKRNRQDKTCQNTIDYSNLSIYAFIIKLAVMYHDMLADKSAFNYEFTNSATELFLKNFNFEEFVKKVTIEKEQDYNYLVYYYYLFMCNYYPENENYYSMLKEHSFKDFEELSDAEKSGRFLYLINYCLMQIESGNMKYLRETFNIYTQTLEKKLHRFDTKDKDIGLMFFRNFVMVGLAAKEYDYIEKFIAEYSEEIKGDHKKDLLRICHAMLHFEKKEYDIALDYLSKLDQNYPAFRLGIKHLYIKIYFEMNEYTSFFSLMDTYKHYLKNDRTIPDRIKELHTNFLNYAGRLAKIKSSGNSGGVFELIGEMKENKKMDFRHRLWLIEKADSLVK